MTISGQRPGAVFAALGDPTRRQIVDWLAEGGNRTATQFAAELPMSRQAVARHLNELRDAGLVKGTKRGREVQFELVTEPLSDAAAWLTDRAGMWETSLRRLVDHIRESS